MNFGNLFRNETWDSKATTIRVGTVYYRFLDDKGIA
jgi:hypothetical protein